MTSSDRGATLRAVVGGARGLLLAHGLDRQAGMLAALQDSPGEVVPADAGPNRPPPVVELFAAAAAVALAGPPPVAALAAALAGWGPGARWTRTAGYLQAPPSPTFLDRYAYATLAHRPDLGDDPEQPVGASLGVLLLGPDTHYPLHQHLADEVYLPLTVAGWTRGHGEAYRPEPAGVPLHHRPWQPHGMVTSGRPLLAIYLWTGGVATPSRFC